LKSGGYLVINQTEALVSIDVNSGRSTREHSIEDTALQTNLEAADEIARQLRLRDLAGLIVIDFIDMEENRNNRAVEKRIKDALKNDRARIQVGRISHFGLLEMSRQRIRASVMESTMEICPHCDGSGHVRSSSSIALHVFRSIEDHLTRHSRNDVIVRCPAPIAVNILNAKRSGLVELENRFGVRISVDADDTLPGQSFLIERGDAASGTVVPSSQPRQADTEPEVAIEEDTDDDVRAGASERGDDGGKRRRRRRRRGKRDASEMNLRDTDGADSDDDEEQDDGSKATAVNGVAADDEDAEDKPRRRRRRGKRGGKRNRRESEEAETVNASEDMETESEGNGGDSVAEQETPPSPKQPEAEDIAADGRKSSIMAERLPSESKQAGAVSEEDESSSSTSAGQDAAVSSRGRNTRRPKTPAPRVKEAEKEVVAVDTDEAKGEPKSKKSGWWSRGGGFFN
jgi:ribonuclease E